MLRQQDEWQASRWLPTSSNLLLKQMPTAERALLEPRLELETLPIGTVLAEPGQRIASIYFPVDALISIEQSGGIEVAVAGREGMFGWSGVTSFSQSPFRAVVRGREAQLLKLPVETVLVALATSPALRSMLFQYLMVMAIQMSEAIAAQGLHQLHAQVARWLLVRHDRMGGDEIRAYHDEIAKNLGSRRASITDCLHIFEGESYIKCRRGRIFIRDRSNLERMAGGCYGAAEAHYRSSFGSFGKASA